MRTGKSSYWLAPQGKLKFVHCDFESIEAADWSHAIWETLQDMSLQFVAVAVSRGLKQAKIGQAVLA